jgi:hypothetical protein
MTSEAHDRELFEQAFRPPGAAGPYDLSQPFDAEKLLDGFTVEERQVPVDPDTPLGRAMAEAREAWAAQGYVPLDPDTWRVEPIPVDVDDE